MGLTIGVDIGGTKVAGGVVDDQGKILFEERRGTPARDSEAVITTILEVISELADSHRPADRGRERRERRGLGGGGLRLGTG
jgi:glucokinase